MFEWFVLSLQIGSLQAPFAIPEEIEARENKMKDYFFKEIDRLVNEKQLCYVKTIAIAANVIKSLNLLLVSRYVIINIVL